MVGRLREGVSIVRVYSKQMFSRVANHVRQIRNQAQYKADRSWVALSHWEQRHRRTSLLCLIGLVLTSSGLLTANLQPVLEHHFGAPDTLAAAQTLLVTLGGALVGAAAIAFSVLIFSMQVNIERMPHTLFQRVSSDPMLMLQLAAMIALSLGINNRGQTTVSCEDRISALAGQVTPPCPVEPESFFPVRRCT